MSMNSNVGNLQGYYYFAKESTKNIPFSIFRNKKLHQIFLSKILLLFLQSFSEKIINNNSNKIAMKIEFLNPEVEVIKLQTNDVIATSDPIGTGGDMGSEGD